MKAYVITGLLAFLVVVIALAIWSMMGDGEDES